MRTVSPGVARPSRQTVRPDGRLTDQMVGSILSDIARTLWPHNTAAHLAAGAQCTVRAAERYLADDREWSGDAIAAVVAEIMRRHSTRNIKIKAR